MLFLLFLLLPFTTLLLLQGAQWYLKNTTEERMQHRQVITVSLPAAHAVWHKKGKELSINGKLFDIKTLYVANGILTVTGFYDEEEISLVHLLSELTSPENNNGLLYFLLVLQCFAASLLFYSIRGMDENKIRHLSFFSCSLPKPFCCLAKQPPRY